MVVHCLLFFLALGLLAFGSEHYDYLPLDVNECFFFTKGSSVGIHRIPFFHSPYDISTPNEIEIISFDAAFAHFEHYSEEQLEHYAIMNKSIVMDKDGWGVQVDKDHYEPEVFTLLNGGYHNLQNITRTGKYCYLTRGYPEKNVTGSEMIYPDSGLYVSEINSSLMRNQIIGIISFISMTFYSLVVSLSVWHWSLSRIIFWRELASFFYGVIMFVQVVRDSNSIVTEAMQSCFNVSMLALYFKPDNIVTPLILGLSLLQAILFVEEPYARVCMVDIPVFTIFLTVNFLFMKKSWDKRSELGVLVQLERLWILLERFFVPHTFQVLMGFMANSSFYKKYILYDESFSINGFNIEYRTYYVLLKLFVIGGGLYSAKPKASYTKRHMRASNGQLLLMLALCIVSVFILVGLIVPLLKGYGCVYYDNFSPNGYLAADFFISQTDPSFEKGFMYAQQITSW